MSRQSDSTASGVTAAANAVARLRLPQPRGVFARRAARFRALAAGHAIGDFLAFLGRLADAQDRLCQLAADLPERRDAAPLSPARLRSDTSWQAGLQAIVSEMRQGELPPETVAALDRLARAETAEVQGWASALLSHDAGRTEPAVAPFVGAALQVHYTRLASGAGCTGSELQTPGRPIGSSSSTCPVCGSPPVAGIVGGGAGLRYLACSLCAAEWHLTRLTCATCASTSALSYLAIDGGPMGVKAEACAACHTYLKLFYLEELSAADAVADDVASLALDLLMAEEGYARAGVNLLLA